MSFAFPLALVLLLVIPLVLYVGWPRQRFRRTRDTLSLVLRVIIVLLLVLSLAGASVAQSADRVAVVFLVDASDSMGQTAQQQALDFVRDSLRQMAPDDLAAVVLFGANALVERQMSTARDLAPVRSVPVTGNSDLGGAVRLALAIFPDDVGKRIVILSDGRATVGDARAMAQMAQVAGVQIGYVPFTRAPSPEVQLLSVHVPEVVAEGQQFDLSVSIQAQNATRATLTVLAAGAVIHRQDIDLRAGVNNYTLPLLSGGTGFRDFEVRVDPLSGDHFYQNNALATFSRVVGPQRVLVVAGSADETRYLVPALQNSGLVVDTALPSSLPIGMGALAQYDSIILANVPATDLSNRRMDLLDSYVKDLGGGLVVLGGPQSYGPGGYFQTPLEDALPVEMQIRDQQRLPQLTIAYVIDRSGSMSIVSPSGVENIELAKEAIIRSIDFLQPRDRAAVISFDSGGSYVAPFQNVNDRGELQQLVGTLRSSGGTDILAGMNLAARDIVQETSQYRHIILLTDGGADPTGLVPLTTRLFQDEGVTTSVIAIGQGIPPFLQQMAQAGGGNFHSVIDVQQIPLIFAQETVLATRSYIIEETFFPTQVSRTPMLDGILSVPQLLGYIATTPKDTAQVIFRTPDDNADPILAAWQYGLGRSVAFTSDATARWGQNWVGWESYARFWSQVVRWTMTDSAGNVETRVEMVDGQARLIVDVRDDSGSFLNGLGLQASIVSPDPDAPGQIVNLQQVAPGRYQATFTPAAQGAYFMRIIGGGGQIQINQTTGWVMNYSPEYDVTFNTQNGELLLRELADITGGRSLAGDAAGVFTRDLTIAGANLPVAPWLLLLALLLLPFDIAVRRLVITRSDLERVRAYFFPDRQVVQERIERINTLLGAKNRAAAKIGQPLEEEAAQQQAASPANAPAPGGTIGALKNRRAAQQNAQPTGAPASGGTLGALKNRRAAAQQDAANVAPAPPAANAAPAAKPAPSARRQDDDKPRAKAPETPTVSADGENVAGRLLRRRRGGEPGDDGTASS